MWKAIDKKQKETTKKKLFYEYDWVMNRGSSYKITEILEIYVELA